MKPRKSERERETETERERDLERFDVNVPPVAMVRGPNHYTALM
jgi:hypothetical protein